MTSGRTISSPSPTEIMSSLPTWDLPQSSRCDEPGRTLCCPTHGRSLTLPERPEPHRRIFFHSLFPRNFCTFVPLRLIDCKALPSPLTIHTKLDPFLLLLLQWEGGGTSYFLFARPLVTHVQAGRRNHRKYGTPALGPALDSSATSVKYFVSRLRSESKQRMEATFPHR